MSLNSSLSVAAMLWSKFIIYCNRKIIVCGLLDAYGRLIEKFRSLSIEKCAYEVPRPRTKWTKHSVAREMASTTCYEQMTSCHLMHKGRGTHVTADVDRQPT